ncbi:hypothetical protein SAMN02745166_02372 [Prosthecobacter debontii]|uniref:DUF1761 domain-containing protein n=1 Tax=Prosthecobacter debontii TaxID=48467 RepID=A0A1T4Y4J4_9BACT|nr:hypothetical protein [Prosthecobacter debontii]SKA96205.1 hypothetical protein SAMN02745166_02372 [Prosthecobacter debontii]
MSACFFLAWAGYVVVTFGLGFVWHLVLFKDTYRKLAIFSRIDDPIIPLGLSAMLIQGAILAYLFPFIQQDGSIWMEGLRFGGILGLFIASSAVIAEAAKQRVASLSKWLLLESTYYLIQFSLAGITIAAAYSRCATN